MIEVFGSEDTEERRVADAVADAFRRQWPDIDVSDSDHVRIVSNAKIYGYEVQDLDVVVIARFGSGRSFTPRRALRGEDHNPVVLRRLFVNSIALVIEVKAHDPRRVRFDGTVVRVRYARGGWHDATEQNVKQLHSLKAYLVDSGVEPLWLSGLLVMTSLEASDLPSAPHNILPSRFGAADLLTTVAEISSPRIDSEHRQGSLSSGSAYRIDAALSTSIFRTITPSAIDRRRMDRIAAREAASERWRGLLGEIPLILRGRGGTGKTVILLQLAYQAYRDAGARTLFLTYNLALLADVRRTMALLGIPSTLETGGIRVDSVMSFVGRLLSRLGLIPVSEDLIDAYEEASGQLRTMLADGSLNAHDLRELLDGDSELFGYDHVMVDEAQDWPEPEIEILCKLFEPRSIAIADGLDQLVRGRYADWRASLAPAKAHVELLRRSLRMKRNLARFSNAFAQSLGLASWQVEPSRDAPGGRVIVLEGSYLDHADLHDSIGSVAALGDAQPIDVLFCVPPSQVVEDESGGRASTVAAWLRQRGEEVWDGASRDVRRDIPRSERQYRVVQYQSCRGLEGWLVVCLGLDELYDLKLDEFRHGADHRENLETAAAVHAGLWTMIPICRAMDTIVICLSGESGPVRDALDAARRALPDVVEWCE